MYRRMIRSFIVLGAIAAGAAACSGDNPTSISPAGGPSLDGGVTFGSGNGVGTGGGGSDGGATTTNTTTAADSGSTARGGVTFGSGN